MIIRVGRYTKHETAELTRIFGEGHSVYKICRNLNRSQNSIRNNLIKLGLMEGEITPRRVSKVKSNDTGYDSIGSLILNYIYYLFILILLSIVFVINPHLNIVDTILFYVVNIILIL